MFTITGTAMRASLKRLNDLQKKHIPYATALALNETAKQVKQAAVMEMRRAFKAPTNYTLNALWIRYAKKTRLTAVVALKDGQNHYLAVQIHGGPRRQKRFEWHMQSAGLLQSGFLVPAAAGHLSRGDYSRMLSQLKAHPDRLSRSTSSARSRRNTAKKPMFYSRGERLARGVWERAGESVKPVMIEARRPTYTKRFRFYEVSEATSVRVYPSAFKQAIKRALATAR